MSTISVILITILVFVVAYIIFVVLYYNMYNDVNKEGFRARSQNFVVNNRFDNANKLDYGKGEKPGMYTSKPPSIYPASDIDGVGKNSGVDVYDNRGYKWTVNGTDPKVDAFVDAATDLELRNKFQRTYMLDPDGSVAQYDLTYNKTSPNCCPATYSPPFKVTDNDKDNCDYAQKYVANQYSGNNFDSSTGCVCVTPKQATFYGNRGGNGGEYYKN